MEVIAQNLDDILASLRPLTVEWKDETAHRVIERLKTLPVKKTYAAEDIKALLDENFDEGILICRLFMGMSKDQFVSVLRGIRGDEGIGVKSYRAKQEAFIEDLLSTGQGSNTWAAAAAFRAARRTRSTSADGPSPARTATGTESCRPMRPGDTCGACRGRGSGGGPCPMPATWGSRPCSG